MKRSGRFAIGDHLKRLLETGDPLETLARLTDFKAFRLVLDAGLPRSDGASPQTRCQVQGADPGGIE